MVSGARFSDNDRGPFLIRAAADDINSDCLSARKHVVDTVTHTHSLGGKHIQATIKMTFKTLY